MAILPSGRAGARARGDAPSHCAHDCAREHRKLAPNYPTPVNTATKNPSVTAPLTEGSGVPTRASKASERSRAAPAT